MPKKEKTTQLTPEQLISSFNGLPLNLQLDVLEDIKGILKSKKESATKDLEALKAIDKP